MAWQVPVNKHMEVIRVSDTPTSNVLASFTSYGNITPSVAYLKQNTNIDIFGKTLNISIFRANTLHQRNFPPNSVQLFVSNSDLGQKYV